MSDVEDLENKFRSICNDALRELPLSSLLSMTSSTELTCRERNASLDDNEADDNIDDLSDGIDERFDWGEFEFKLRLAGRCGLLGGIDGRSADLAGTLDACSICRL